MQKKKDAKKRLAKLLALRLEEFPFSTTQLLRSLICLHARRLGCSFSPKLEPNSARWPLVAINASQPHLYLWLPLENMSRGP